MLFAGSYKKYSVVLSILIISTCSGNSALSTGRDLTLRMNGSKMDEKILRKYKTCMNVGYLVGQLHGLMPVLEIAIL
jgi:hypothetical protein